MKKQVGRNYTVGKSDEELIGHIGFGGLIEVDIEEIFFVLTHTFLCKSLV